MVMLSRDDTPKEVPGRASDVPESHRHKSHSPNGPIKKRENNDMAHAGADMIPQISNAGPG